MSRIIVRIVSLLLQEHERFSTPYNGQWEAQALDSCAGILGVAVLQRPVEMRLRVVGATGPDADEQVRGILRHGME